MSTTYYTTTYPTARQVRYVIVITYMLKDVIYLYKRHVRPITALQNSAVNIYAIIFTLIDESLLVL